VAYHYTDSVGQQILGIREHSQRLADDIVTLEAELQAERESHRHENLRLVKRAEEAEDAAKRWATMASELNDRVDALHADRDRWQERATAAEVQEDQLRDAATNGSQLAQERLRLLTDANRRVIAAEDKLTELVAHVRAATDNGLRFDLDQVLAELDIKESIRP
jgi:chromosome segregation ATPase